MVTGLAEVQLKANDHLLFRNLSIQFKRNHAPPRNLRIAVYRSYWSRESAPRLFPCCFIPLSLPLRCCFVGFGGKGNTSALLEPFDIPSNAQPDQKGRLQTLQAAIAFALSHSLFFFSYLTIYWPNAGCFFHIVRCRMVSRGKQF